MSRVAIINKGVVTNTIVWDREAEPDYDYGKDSGTEAIDLNDDSSVGIGWLYANGEFSAPPLSEAQQQSKDEEAKNENIFKKQSLMDAATQKIVVWQTKLLMGRKLSDSDSASLEAWMDYIDALDAIDAETSSSVQWPASP